MNPPSMTTDQMMAIMKELADLRIQRDLLIERLQMMEQELTKVQPKEEVDERSN